MRAEEPVPQAHKKTAPPPPQGGAPGAAVPFGVPVGPPMRACPGCATPVPVLATICAWCATTLASPRSKRRAVILAVILSFWTWIYTYRRDHFRFWLGLSLNIFGMFVPAHALGESAILFVWIWAVVDTATKPKAWYRWYPNK